MTSYKSGKCPACPYTVRLRKDGTIGRHILSGGYYAGIDSNWYMEMMTRRGRIYLEADMYVCEGTGKYPRSK